MDVVLKLQGVSHIVSAIVTITFVNVDNKRCYFEIQRQPRIYRRSIQFVV